MKIFLIAWKDVRIRMRDRKGLLLMILMPVILTAILGMALNGFINGDASSLPRMTVAIYNGDSGELGKRLVQDVLQSDDLKPYVIVEHLGSGYEVGEKVQDGKADAGIVIPYGFSDRLMSGQSAKIDVLKDPGKFVPGQVVLSLVTSFTDRAAAVASASRVVIADLATTVPVARTVTADFQTVALQVVNEIQQKAASPNVSVIEQPYGKKAVSGKQYYAAAMAAMFLLFNATVGAKSILHERYAETLARMLCTPTGKTEILLGKYLGTLLYSIIQFAIFMGVTYLLFGVDWGENVAQSLAIGFVYAIAVSGLSFAIAAVVSTERAADLVAGFGVQIMAVLGGSMVPLAFFPDVLRKIALAVPNAWALNSFLDIMTGTTWQALALPISVLLGLGAASLAFGAWRLRVH